MPRPLIIAALASAFPLAAMAQNTDLPKEVGQQIAIGLNLTGEQCNLRLTRKNTGERGWWENSYSIYCGEWNQPSGNLYHFKSNAEWSPARYVDKSGWLNGNFVQCGAVEDIAMASGAKGKARQCHRTGGWAVLAVALDAGGAGFLFDALPANMPALERAVAALSGKPIGDIDKQGTQSAAIRRAEGIMGPSGKLLKAGDIAGLADLRELALWYNWSRSYYDAELAYRRVIQAQETTGGIDNLGKSRSFSDLALNVNNQGRMADAEALYAEAERLSQKSGKQDLAYFHRLKSIFERRRGNYEVARALAASSAAQFFDLYGQNATSRGSALLDEGRALFSLNRLDEAAEKSRTSLQIYRAAHGELYSWTGFSLEALADIYSRQKKYDEALRHNSEALKVFEALYGKNSARAAVTHFQRMEILIGSSRPDEAYRAGFEGLKIASIDKLTRDNFAFFADSYSLRLASRFIAAAEKSADVEKLGNAFWVAQLVSGGTTAMAVRSMSARMAADDPALGKAVRESQDARRREFELQSALGTEMARPPKQRDQQNEGRLRAEAKAAAEEGDRIDAQLAGRFPSYSKLVSNLPANREEIESVMRPLEALLNIVPLGTHGVYAIFLRDRTMRVHRTGLTSQALRDHVNKLRASLDWTTGEKPFEAGSAHELYRELIAPFADMMKDVSHLIVAASGPIASLPLGVLLTEPAPPGAAPASMAWLGKAYAVSVVPGVSSLRDLRARAGRSSAPQAFIGIGDPAFAGAKGNTRAADKLAELCRGNEGVDLALIRDLPALPETRNELTMIGRALKARPEDLLFGAKASEATLRSTDLSRYRVVAFATHGLLPGEIKCLSQPALVLTPPAASKDGDDGLLDAGEIAQMKLDADWVILSACNTAGPDGSFRAESLSGLARAFFYAGARAVLASHWAVESNATAQLTTTMIETHAKAGNTGGRAHALRSAQMALMAQPATAHPVFWAAFSLIGDGG